MNLTRGALARLAATPPPPLRTPPRRPVPTAAVRPQPNGRIRRVSQTRRVHATAAPPEHVAVIGGGITGLTTAHYLARWLPPSSRVTLYEAADRLGGWMHSVRRETNGGVVHFENGPRTLRGLGRAGFRADDYVFYDLITDLKLPLRISPPRKKLFCYDDTLVHLPPLLTPSSLLRTAWQFARGKHILSGMRTAALRYRRHRMRNFPPDTTRHDISIGDWLRMALGDDLPGPRNVLSGMMHGIYGGSIDNLGLASVLPAVWYGTYMPAGPDEQLIPRQDYNLLKELDPRKRGIEKEVREWSVAEVMSFPEGMDTLVEGMREALGRCPNVTIETRAPVTGIQYRPEQDKVELSTPSEPPSLHDKVISTTPSGPLSPLLPTVPLPTTSVSIMTVSFFFPQEDLTAHHQAFGYLVPLTTPNPEQALGVFFDSDTYGLAPGEKRGTKLTVLMGGHLWSGSPVPSEDECVERARAMLARHLGLTATPELTHVHLAQGCIPQHTPSHRAQLARSHAALRDAFNGRLAVAGGSYTPVGVMPAMRAGYDAARHVAGWSMAHVGDTGLAQFEEGLDVMRVPVDELNELGKRLRASGALGRWFSGR